MSINITPAMQKQMLAYLLQQEGALATYRTHISASFFESHIQKQIILKALEYYDAYDGTPSKATMESLCESLAQEKDSEAKYLPEYLSMLGEIYDPLSESDQKFILDNIAKVIKVHKMEEAALAAVDLMAEEKFSEAAEVFGTAAAFQVGDGEDVDFVNLGEYDFENIANQFLGVPISTGYSNLDTEMHGGIRPGELGIVCGPPSSGKSMWLINFAIGALKAGKTFLYVTLELSATQVIQRMAACLTGMDYWGIAMDKNYNMNLQMSIEALRAEFPSFDQCAVLHRNNGEITAPELKQLVAAKYADKKIPDIILIDYADLLRFTTDYGSMYEDCGFIYAQLFNMAKGLDIPIWTATQANRDGAKSKFLDLQHMSDSFKKAFVADTVYMICRDEYDKESKVMRLYSAKQRSHQGQNYHFFKTQFTIGRIAETTQEYYENVKVATPVGIGKKSAAVNIKNMLGNHGIVKNGMNSNGSVNNVSDNGHSPGSSNLSFLDIESKPS